VTRLATALLFVTPAPAWACPACAGSGSGGIGRIIVLGGMILLPFAIALTVRYFIRRFGRDTDGARESTF